MAQPRRHDSYGRPLPTLADARQACPGASSGASLLERPQNQRQRTLIARLLQAEYEALLQRGVYAEVTVHFRVSDGVLRSHVEISVQRRWGQGAQEEDVDAAR